MTPGLAWSQANPPVGPSLAPPTPPLPFVVRPNMAIDGIMTGHAALHEARRNNAEAVLARRNREGMERAERLAAMVNEGRCGDAFRTALNEGDPIMAQKIRAACSSQPTISVGDPIPVDEQ